MTKTAPSLEDIPTSELLKLENQLCFPLYACSKEVVRRYTPILDEFDLTYTQYLVMLALWEHDSLSVTQLGNTLYLDSGTLTPLLKKLEAKGLVTRGRSEQDERKLIVALTEQGKAMKEHARKIPLAMGQCVDLTPEEGAQLVALLRKVISSVNA